MITQTFCLSTVDRRRDEYDIQGWLACRATRERLTPQGATAFRRIVMSIFRPLISLKSDVVRGAGRYDYSWPWNFHSWSPLRSCRQPRGASLRLHESSAR